MATAAADLFRPKPMGPHDGSFNLATSQPDQRQCDRVGNSNMATHTRRPDQRRFCDRTRFGPGPPNLPPFPMPTHMLDVEEMELIAARLGGSESVDGILSSVGLPPGCLLERSQVLEIEEIVAGISPQIRGGIRGGVASRPPCARQEIIESMLASVRFYPNGALIAPPGAIEGNRYANQCWRPVVRDRDWWRGTGPETWPSIKELVNDPRVLFWQLRPPEQNTDADAEEQVVGDQQRAPGTVQAAVVAAAQYDARRDFEIDILNAWGDHYMVSAVFARYGPCLEPQVAAHATPMSISSRSDDNPIAHSKYAQQLARTRTFDPSP
jgi:hypothetical protein